MNVLSLLGGAIAVWLISGAKDEEPIDLPGEPGKIAPEPPRSKPKRKRRRKKKS